MLVIRLSRTGRKKQPSYRVVVAEHSAPIKGQVIEVLGHYNPRTKELKVDVEQAKKRLAHGAQPSQTAEALLAKAGVLTRPKIIRRPTKNKKQKEEKMETPSTQIKADGDEQQDAPAGGDDQPVTPTEGGDEKPADGGDTGDAPASDAPTGE